MQVTVQEEFMTTEQVAEIFRCSVSTVCRWIDGGKITGAIRPGGRVWLIPRTEVDRLMQPETTERAA